MRGCPAGGMQTSVSPAASSLRSESTSGLSRHLLHLAELELDRCRATEDRHGHLEPRTFLVDLFHVALEGGERAVGDFHLLAHLEVIEGFGRSTPSVTWRRMRIASSSEIGIGLFSAPRNPVTFGVFLISKNAGSVISIFTST